MKKQVYETLADLVRDVNIYEYGTLGNPDIEL